MRDVPLGDVGDFMRQHSGQFGFMLQVLQQAGVHKDEPPGTAKALSEL